MNASRVLRGFRLEDHVKNYDPSKIGGLYVPAMIEPSLHAMARQEMRDLEAKGLFIKDDEVAGPANVIQRSHTLHLGSWGMVPGESPPVRLEDLPGISLLAGAHVEIVHNPLARAMGFPEVEDVNSVNLRVYPENVEGIGSHRDLSSSINLVGIYALDGVCLFFMSRTRNGMAVRYTMRPGDAMFLRANHRPNRGDDVVVPDLRPFHKVKVASKKRYVAIMRIRSA